MWRMAGLLCALGLAAAPGSAGGADGPLGPPLTAGSCTLHQREQCARVERHAIERDLDCGACVDTLPMPAELLAPPASARPPLPCATREMPLSPPLPGCLPPPTDRIPPL